MSLKGVKFNDYTLEVPTSTSDLTNDSGFITNEVTDLVNYYSSTDTDSKFLKKVLNNSEFVSPLNDESTGVDSWLLTNTSGSLQIGYISEDFSGFLMASTEGVGGGLISDSFTAAIEAIDGLGDPIVILTAADSSNETSLYVTSTEVLINDIPILTEDASISGSISNSTLTLNLLNGSSTILSTLSLDLPVSSGGNADSCGLVEVDFDARNYTTEDSDLYETAEEVGEIKFRATPTISVDTLAEYMKATTEMQDFDDPGTISWYIWMACILYPAISQPPMDSDGDWLAEMFELIAYVLIYYSTTTFDLIWEISTQDAISISGYEETYSPNEEVLLFSNGNWLSFAKLLDSEGTRVVRLKIRDEWTNTNYCLIVTEGMSADDFIENTNYWIKSGGDGSDVDLSSYLTTSTASSTYQTLANLSASSITSSATKYPSNTAVINYVSSQLSSYLPTSTASSTYQTLANLSTSISASSTKYPSNTAVINYVSTQLSGYATTSDLDSYALDDDLPMIYILAEE